VPHTGPKPLVPYSTQTQGRRRISISRPVSSGQEVKQTGQAPGPLPKQPDIQTETTEENPQNHRSAPPNARVGGPEGRAPQKAPNKPKQPRTNNRTRHRGKPARNRGKGRAHPPRRQSTAPETPQQQSKNTPKPTQEAKGKGQRKTKNQERATKEIQPRYSKIEFRMEGARRLPLA
jgi:hypothetical protein